MHSIQSEMVTVNHWRLLLDGIDDPGHELNRSHCILLERSFIIAKGVTVQIDILEAMHILNMTNESWSSTRTVLL